MAESMWTHVETALQELLTTTSFKLKALTETTKESPKQRLSTYFWPRGVSAYNRTEIKGWESYFSNWDQRMQKHCCDPEGKSKQRVTSPKKTVTDFYLSSPSVQSYIKDEYGYMNNAISPLASPNECFNKLNHLCLLCYSMFNIVLSPCHLLLV